MKEEKKQKLSEKLLSLSNDIEKNKYEIIGLQFRLLKKFFGMIVIYGFISALFLGLYESIGFERTLVVVGISISYWGVRQNYVNLKRVLILEQVVRNGSKGRNDKKTK